MTIRSVVLAALLAACALEAQIPATHIAESKQRYAAVRDNIHKAAEAMPGVTVVRDGDFIGVAAPNQETATRAAKAIAVGWKAPDQPSNRELFDYLRKHRAEGRGEEGCTEEACGEEARGAEAQIELEAEEARLWRLDVSVSRVSPSP